MTKSNSIAAVLVAALAALAAFSLEASAHELAWRDGEMRQAGFGRCAKGPCMKRTVWSRSKPHRHVGGKVAGLCRHPSHHIR
jgi:hypothetical protein